jgi:hypothetical protein
MIIAMCFRVRAGIGGELSAVEVSLHTCLSDET